jgi:hypothetical protein
MTQENKLDKILKNMERVNNSFSYEVWIPSLNKHVRFKEINTSQQKRLVKSIIDSPVYKTQFILTAKDIIEENLVDKDLDVTSLTILDKMFILVKMRSVSIGKDIEIEMASKINEEVKYKTKVDLDKILSSAKKDVKEIKPEEIVVGQYKVVCNIPNILCEYKLEEELRQHEQFSLNDVQSIEEVREMIGVKYINELCKFTQSLEITGGDDVEIYNFVDFSFADRIQIIESLPAKVIKSVLKYAENVTKELNKISLINKQATIDGQKEDFEYQLELDATFFTDS